MAEYWINFNAKTKIKTTDGFDLDLKLANILQSNNIELIEINKVNKINRRSEILQERKNKENGLTNQSSLWYNQYINKRKGYENYGYICKIQRF